MPNTRKVTIIRNYDVRPEQVFKAWTEPEQFQHWWGGTGATVPLESIKMDVRPGGSWQAEIKFEGGAYPFHGRYLDVVANKSLSFSLIDPNDDDFDKRAADGGVSELLTVDLEPTDGGGTQMSFTQLSGHLDPDELQKSADGLATFFDALAVHLDKN